MKEFTFLFTSRYECFGETCQNDQPCIKRRQAEKKEPWSGGEKEREREQEQKQEMTESVAEVCFYWTVSGSNKCSPNFTGENSPPKIFTDYGLEFAKAETKAEKRREEKNTRPLTPV